MIHITNCLRVVNGRMFIQFQLRRRRVADDSPSTSSTSRISAQEMQNILDSLLMQQTRKSTMKNYVCVWRQFNRFIVNLDIIPKNWEDRASLFIGYLIQVKQM